MERYELSVVRQGADYWWAVVDTKARKVMSEDDAEAKWPSGPVARHVWPIEHELWLRVPRICEQGKP